MRLCAREHAEGGSLPEGGLLQGFKFLASMFRTLAMETLNGEVTIHSNEKPWRKILTDKFIENRPWLRPKSCIKSSTFPFVMSLKWV